MSRQTALITGATSGIGKAFAEHFASRGYDLILTGRRKEVITAVARRLKQAYGIAVTVVIAELSDRRGVRPVLRTIMKTDDLSVLVNNAGYGERSLFINLPVREHLDMVEAHVNAVLRLVHAALPRMIKKKNGIIINVASLGAYAPAPINGVYGGTKSFLNVFTESLHMEVRRYGIRVQSLCPGFTRTDFHRKLGIEEEIKKNRTIRWMAPERVVKISMKRLGKGKVICIPGIRNKILYHAARLMPRRIYYRMTEKLYGPYLGRGR